MGYFIMTPSQINIKIAELCGLNPSTDGYIPNPESGTVGFHAGYIPAPNYHSSLDACREFELSLRETQKGFYNSKLFLASCKVNLAAGVKEPIWIFEAITATAPQRCEAFLRLHNHTVVEHNGYYCFHAKDGSDLLDEVRELREFVGSLKYRWTSNAHILVEALQLLEKWKYKGKG
jgi:hypothetical protein